MRPMICLVYISVTVIFAQLMIACSGRVVATAPPPPQTEVVVVRPSPRHVWVPGHYAYRRNEYYWSPGYYKVPPRSRTTWVAGHWQQTNRGYVWIDGHWR